jgi:RNA polymerase sigma factor (sigma-70 family)
MNEFGDLSLTEIRMHCSLPDGRRFPYSFPNFRLTCSFLASPATHWMYGKKDARMRKEAETSFLANLNQNIGIVHQVCHTYFRRDAMEREDVFQDIMYQLWKSYPQFKGESKFSTWMYKVALNTAITHVRRKTRTPQNAELTESVAQDLHTNEHMSRVEEVRLLHEAIAALTDIDKAIILLHLEDQSYDEIASITGLTKTNVSVRLVRIKRALKDYLQRNQ